jgi:hypothetical protein
MNTTFNAFTSIFGGLEPLKPTVVAPITLTEPRQPASPDDSESAFENTCPPDLDWPDIDTIPGQL